MRLRWRHKKQIRATLLSEGGDRVRASQHSEQSVRMNGAHDIIHITGCGSYGRMSARAPVRIGMMGVVFATIFVGLAVRLINISLNSDLRTNRQEARFKSDQDRADITDRNGVVLALNLPTLALEVSGKDTWDPAETAQALTTILKDIDTVSLQKKLAQKRHVEVRSNLTPEEQARIFALGLPGIEFTRRHHRFYPHGALAAHLVGHVERGHVRPSSGGIMGLEKLIDRHTDGEILVASLDIRVQQALEDVLLEQVTAFQAEAAWGGVMDVATGEIIALANWPEFDPNRPTDVGVAARRNRMTYDRYDLGSAFKAITAASLLESGMADENTPYDARGTHRVAGVTFRDFHGQNRILTLSEVIQYSSNIGAVRIAMQLGAERHKRFLRSLGFFDALPIELAENRQPQLPQKWGPVERATVSYGHGIAVTPLHLLAGFAAVINDGVYRVPLFTKNPMGISSGKPVFSTPTIAQMRRILRRTVTNGTARRADVPGYFTIGKTATADEPGPGGYRKDRGISSFVGAFPGYAPRYAVLLSFSNPQPQDGSGRYATAGKVAAPAFGMLVKRIAPILGVPMVEESTAVEAFFFDQLTASYDTQRSDTLTQAALEPVMPRDAAQASSFSTLAQSNALSGAAP